jgi:hypothetical protein
MTDIGWRKTDLGDNENDFVAYDGEDYVGRVYLVTTAGTAAYWGFFPAKGGGSGKAPSRREAMLEVEKWWRISASSSPAE